MSDLVFGNVIELDDRGRETPARGIAAATCVLGSEEFIRLSGAENIVATCSAVVRTDLQKRLGGYRHELPHAGDMEMWLRFAVHARVGFISEYQGVYRQHRTNMSAAHYFIEAGHLTFRENGRLADLQQRKVALDCFSEYCRGVCATTRAPLSWALSTAFTNSGRACERGFQRRRGRGGRRASGICPRGLPGDQEFSEMAETGLQAFDGRAGMERSQATGGRYSRHSGPLAPPTRGFELSCETLSVTGVNQNAACSAWLND